MRKIHADARYGFKGRSAQLARLARVHRMTWVQVRKGIPGAQFLYPGQPERILRVIKQVREGRLKLVKIKANHYEALPQDPPKPPIEERELRVSVDFRGCHVGIMPAAPPARRMPSPVSVMGRAVFWAPKRRG
jgi:hypothetical protein